MSELIQVSVPTKKIELTITENEKLEIVLRPFKQLHFAQAIAIINKYFDQINQVRNDYVSQRKAILDKYEDEVTRNLALLELDAGFNEGMEIAKAILSVGNGVAEDIKTIIQMSIFKATQIITADEGKERSPIDPDLDNLTWGECLVMLGSVVGLNMDFFSRNMEKMNLKEILEDKKEPRQKQKTGVKSSAA